MPPDIPQGAMDVLESRECEIARVWDDGSFIVEFLDADRPGGELPKAVYYVPAEEAGDTDAWAGFNAAEVDRNMPLLYGELDRRTGFRNHASAVPVSIAVKGKKTLAAYLTAEMGWSDKMIAHHLGVEPDTVQQYRSDFMGGR